jgi:hypothetical protein
MLIELQVTDRSAMCAVANWECGCKSQNKVTLDTKTCRELWNVVMDDNKYRKMNGMNAKKAACGLTW